MSTRPATIRNATTLARSAYDFMASWPFQKGYTDGRTGQPLAYEAFSGTRDQTRYERGRQFAMIHSSKGKQLIVNNLAVFEFQAAANRKEIV